MEHKNTTGQDAYRRVLVARQGSLTNPTIEYLLALKEELGRWMTLTDKALLAKVVENRKKREESLVES